MKISTREKRFLISGGGLTLLVLAYYLASSLIPSREGLTTTVESRKAFLLRQKELLSQEEAYKVRLATYQKRLEEDRNRLLSGDNPSIAVAALQRALQDLADQSGVEITSKTVQPEQKIQDNLTKISVQLMMNCSLDQLVGFLAAVESYERFLRVEELYIQNIRLRNKDEIRPQIKVAGYVATAPAAVKASEKVSGN